MIKNVLIIEDEKPNADRLKRLLKKLKPAINIAGVEDTVTGSVTWLRKNSPPDVILMDVRLADGVSFDIFNQVDVISPIIFTTAYDEYAIKAFKVNSVDYLLKPIEEEELSAALQQCEKVLLNHKETVPDLAGLLDYLQPKDYRTRFLLPYRDSYKTLMISEIGHFYSEFGITKACLCNGDIEVIPLTLEELEKQLDPKTFFRVNRQFIVKIDSIAKIHNYFNGKLKLELKKQPDMEVIVSREKASTLKSWMDY